MNWSMALQLPSMHTVLGQGPIIAEALSHTLSLNLPTLYLGAGCISETIWNNISGMSPQSHIETLDLAYFDPDDLRKKLRAGLKVWLRPLSANGVMV